MSKHEIVVETNEGSHKFTLEKTTDGNLRVTGMIGGFYQLQTTVMRASAATGAKRILDILGVEDWDRL